MINQVVHVLNSRTLHDGRTEYYFEHSGCLRVFGRDEAWWFEAYAELPAELACRHCTTVLTVRDLR